MTSATIDAPVLTEEKILKMGEKDYMNAAQLAFFRAKLTEIKAGLVASAKTASEHLRENETAADPVDRASIEEEHALELRARDRENNLLMKVIRSLNDIDSGEYGWCEETGEPIGVPRLLARPTATLTIEAQSRREFKQKLSGGI